MIGWLVYFSLAGLADAAQVPVFRSPESAFHSGYSQSSILEKNTRTVKDVAWTEVRWQSKPGWVRRKELLFASDFTARGGRIAFSMNNAIFYAQPDVSGKILALLNAGMELKILRTTDQWLRVQMGKLEGYVLAEQAITGGGLARPSSQALAVAEGAALMSTPDHTGKKIAEIPGGELLSVKSSKNIRWGLAELGDLGEVWWPMGKGRQAPPPAPIRKDAHKKPIFDMVTLPFPPYDKVISADGIYRSEGAAWKKLGQFADKNYPLAVAPNGYLFVGPYLSKDRGATFQPFINWQNLLKTFHQDHLPQVSLHSIEVLDRHGREIQVQVHTGAKKRMLYSRDTGQSWNLVR